MYLLAFNFNGTGQDARSAGRTRETLDGELGGIHPNFPPNLCPFLRPFLPHQRLNFAQISLYKSLIKAKKDPPPYRQRIKRNEKKTAFADCFRACEDK
jgi:hypothetical protein